MGAVFPLAGGGGVCLNSPEMRAIRIGMAGLAWAALLGAGGARAGIETFDTTGFGSGSTWTTSGAFTGQQNIVWTYANARGVPTVYEGNPSMALRNSPKGWVRSETLTGGVGRVSVAFKQGSAAAVDCDVRVNDEWIGNYKSSGVSGSVEIVSFEAFVSSGRIPFTNDFVLMVSNRVTTAGVVAVDDLSWDPFRLFVRLDRTGTNTAYAGQDFEFDVEAEVFDVGQAVSGGWTIQPAFAGTVSDTNELALTVHPAAADVGQTFQLTYVAVDPEGGGLTNQASCWMEVLEGPRFIGFEGVDFGYNTNDGVVTNLNGMSWIFRNVQTSWADDRRIGATSARFRHTTAVPAAMESQDAFAGVGTFSLHYAYFGANRTVTFELQVHGDGEDWTTVPGGMFNVLGHDDITNSVFSVDVQRSDDVWLRLVTTGNANELANIDDIRIREYNDLLPRLTWSGETNAPLGREAVLDFTLLNAEGIAREWEAGLAPENSNAVFELTAEDQLRLRFSPLATNEWGEYAVAVTARIAGVAVAETSLVLRVVSAPVFELAPVATNVAVPGIVDVFVTNVVLHGTNLTEWSMTWTPEPLFATGHTLSNKTRYRVGNGTTEADAGPHTLTAVLTDLGTGVRSTQAVVIVVTGSGGVTNESYAIVSFDITNHVAVQGRAGRVYTPFGTTNLTLGAGEGNWVWQGAAVTNTDGSDVILDIPALPDSRLFFYGVKVRAAP